MQYTGLVLSLEKQALQAIRAELMLRHQSRNDQHAQITELTHVHFDDFAVVLLQHMYQLPLESKLDQPMYTHTNAFHLQMASIISVFDAVDIDSRGVIDFTDFTNFCLRLGRLLFKPSIKRTLTSFLQYQTQSNTALPSSKMKYISEFKLLFVMDGDGPRVRLYNKEGKLIHRAMPVHDARKLHRAKFSKTLTYYEKATQEKDLYQFRLIEKELEPSKGTILDILYIETERQLVFSCTNSYIIFTDAKKGLFDVNGNLKVENYARTKHPLYGMHYCRPLDMIIGFPGEGSSHVFEVIDPKTRTLKFEIDKHTTKILTICEVVLDKARPLKNHYFVSSSIDKKVLMWPSAPLSTLLNKNPVKRLLRVADTIDFELRGHDHAIQSIAFAPIQELIFGCGFDYEIYAWDPFTKDLCMRFVGHFKSMVGIQIVNFPNEKLLSIDDSGVIKLWNINKDLGVYGEQESSVAVPCNQPAHIRDFCKVDDDGKVIAVLTEQLNLLKIEGDTLDDLKPVSSGLGICPVSGRIFAIYRSSIQIIDILTSSHVKRVAFLDPDRVSSTDQIINRSDELSMNAVVMTTAQREAQHHRLKQAGFIDIRDTVSAVTFDGKGKKVFIGTTDGRVLLFDSFTFGLLKQLTNEDEDHAFRQQGGVVQLIYVERDELVVAAYMNGAIKIFGGCHHGGYQASQQQQHHSSGRHAAGADSGNNTPKAAGGGVHTTHHPHRHQRKGSMSSHGHRDHDYEEHQPAGPYPRAKGGKPPASPLLLRECDLGIVNDQSIVAMDVSVSQNLISLLTKAGMVFNYDYLTLDFVNCIQMEDPEPIIPTSHQEPPNKTRKILPKYLSFVTEEKDDGSSSDEKSEDGSDAQQQKQQREKQAATKAAASAANATASAATTYVALQYIPMLPLMLVFSNTNQVTVWSVKAMDYHYIYTWNLYDVSHNVIAAQFYERFDWSGVSHEEDHSRFKPHRVAAATSAKVYIIHHDVGQAPTSTMSQTFFGGGLHINTAHKSSSKFDWVLLVGNEDGQLITQDISTMIAKSGALDYLPKADSNLPVYQKGKPKRFRSSDAVDYNTSYPRTSLPDSWAEKINHPLKRSLQARQPAAAHNHHHSSSHNSTRNVSASASVTATTAVMFSTKESLSEAIEAFGGVSMDSAADDVIPASETPRGEGGSGAMGMPTPTNAPTRNSPLRISALSRKTLRLVQKQNRAKAHQGPHHRVLEGHIEEYITGLYAWNAYPVGNIRAISFYHPYLNYLSDHSHTTYEAFEIQPHQHKLPLIVTLSDSGGIRMWTFCGTFLGEHIDEKLGGTSTKAEEAAAAKLAEEGTGEDKSSDDEDNEDEATKKRKLALAQRKKVIELEPPSTTFVMQVLTDDKAIDQDDMLLAPASPSHPGLGNGHGHPGMDSITALSSKIFVVDKKRSLTVRRVSVLNKPTAVAPPVPLSLTTTSGKAGNATHSSGVVAMKSPGSSPTTNNDLSSVKGRVTTMMSMLPLDMSLGTSFSSLQVANARHIVNVSRHDPFVDHGSLVKRPLGAKTWHLPAVAIYLPAATTTSGGTTSTNALSVLHQSSFKGTNNNNNSHAGVLAVTTTSLAALSNKEKDNLEVLPIESPMHFTLVQYSYVKLILAWVLPLIGNEVNRLFHQRVVEALGAEYALRQGDASSVMTGGTARSRATLMHGRKPPRPSSVSALTTRRPKLHTEGSEDMDEEAARELAQQQRRMSMAKERTAKALSTKANDGGLAQILETMTDKELEVAQLLQQQTQKKFEKASMSVLIDYIQANEYFPEDLKQSGSRTFYFEHFESEKRRAMKLPAKNTLDFAQLEADLREMDAARKKKKLGQGKGGSSGGMRSRPTSAPAAATRPQLVPTGISHGNERRKTPLLTSGMMEMAIEAVTTEAIAESKEHADTVFLTNPSGVQIDSSSPIKKLTALQLPSTSENATDDHRTAAAALDSFPGGLHSILPPHLSSPHFIGLGGDSIENNPNSPSFIIQEPSYSSLNLEKNDIIRRSLDQSQHTNHPPPPSLGLDLNANASLAIGDGELPLEVQILPDTATGIMDEEAALGIYVSDSPVPVDEPMDKDNAIIEANAHMLSASSQSLLKGPKKQSKATNKKKRAVSAGLSVSKSNSQLGGISGGSGSGGARAKLYQRIKSAQQLPEHHPQAEDKAQEGFSKAQNSNRPRSAPPRIKRSAEALDNHGTIKQSENGMRQAITTNMSPFNSRPASPQALREAGMQMLPVVESTQEMIRIDEIIGNLEGISLIVEEAQQLGYHYSHQAPSATTFITLANQDDSNIEEGDQLMKPPTSSASPVTRNGNRRPQSASAVVSTSRFNVSAGSPNHHVVALSDTHDFTSKSNSHTDAIALSNPYQEQPNAMSSAGKNSQTQSRRPQSASAVSNHHHAQRVTNPVKAAMLTCKETEYAKLVAHANNKARRNGQQRPQSASALLISTSASSLAFSHSNNDDNNNADATGNLPASNSRKKITENNAVLGQATMANTFSNLPRLQEISQHYNDAVLAAKLASQGFDYYDPARKRKDEEKLKAKNRLKRKLVAAKDRDAYVEDEKFEDYHDIDRETRKLQSRKILQQAQAMGDKSSFGYYRTEDLLGFLHFLDLLTPIVLEDIHLEKQMLLFYYDDQGNDYSKFVKEQAFYEINEVLAYVTEFLDADHLLRHALIFFRDESPALPYIPLFHLIGFVFSLSKSKPLQLRIFMFVISAHKIYDLLQNAQMPRELQAIAAARRQQVAAERDARDRGILPPQMLGYAEHHHNNNHTNSSSNINQPPPRPMSAPATTSASKKNSGDEEDEYGDTKSRQSSALGNTRSSSRDDEDVYEDEDGDEDLLGDDDDNDDDSDDRAKKTARSGISRGTSSVASSPRRARSASTLGSPTHSARPLRKSAVRFDEGVLDEATQAAGDLSRSLSKVRFGGDNDAQPTSSHNNNNSNTAHEEQDEQATGSAGASANTVLAQQRASRLHAQLIAMIQSDRAVNPHGHHHHHGHHSHHGHHAASNHHHQVPDAEAAASEASHTNPTTQTNTQNSASVPSPIVSSGAATAATASGAPAQQDAGANATTLNTANTATDATVAGTNTSALANGGRRTSQLRLNVPPGIAGASMTPVIGSPTTAAQIGTPTSRTSMRRNTSYASASLRRTTLHSSKHSHGHMKDGLEDDEEENETEVQRREKAQYKADVLLLKRVYMVTQATRYVVRPNMTRGFRQWIIRRKHFVKVTKMLNMWCDENFECLNLQDFVDIFHGMVPKHDRENYRIMRSFTMALGRMGLRLITELSGEVLTKIFEGILEIKIISG